MPTLVTQFVTNLGNGATGPTSDPLPLARILFITLDPARIVIFRRRVTASSREGFFGRIEGISPLLFGGWSRYLLAGDKVPGQALEAVARHGRRYARSIDSRFRRIYSRPALAYRFADFRFRGIGPPDSTTNAVCNCAHELKHVVPTRSGANA